jgi:Fe-S-cluster containining protein
VSTIPLRNITECDHCGACCQAAPCTIGSYAELEHIEQTLGRSIRDGLWVARMHDGFFVIISQPPCRFHIDNRCSINEVKPLGGRMFKCWDKSTYTGATGWSEDELRALGVDTNNPQRLRQVV